MYEDAIYIKSKVMSDDVICSKSKELMDEVDHCIANLKGNPAGIYETIHLTREDAFDMRVSFFGDNGYAYVYVSDGDAYDHEDSRPIPIQNGCTELHDHVARVLSAHTH